MKKKLFIAALGLAVLGVSQAQLRKCVGADGRVTFSDVACANTSKSAEVISSRPALQGFDAPSRPAAQRRDYEAPAAPRSAPQGGYQQELTGKIAGHLANGDIGTAASLATTSEHLRMVADAKREKTQSDLAYDANERANKNSRRRDLPTVCKFTSERDGYGPGSRYTSTRRCSKEGE